MDLKLEKDLLAEVERLRKLVSDICVSMCFQPGLPDGFPDGNRIQLQRTDELISHAKGVIQAREQNQGFMDALRKGTTDDLDD